MFSVNVPDSQSWTPLHHAACEGQKEAVAKLLSLKANVELENDEGWTALHLAAANGHIPVVELLLTHNANIHARDFDGRTPLQRACFYGQKATVEYLLVKGARLEDKDNKSKTPLHAAASSYLSSSGRLAVIRFLVEEKKADLGAKTDIKWTPLHSAVRYSGLSTIELLIRLGANKEAKNNYGHTPLIMACYETQLHPANRLAIIDLLLQFQVQIDNQDNLGYTALHMACIRGFKEITERLLKAGADRNILSDVGQKPLHYAAEYGHAELISLLSQQEVPPNKSGSPSAVALTQNRQTILSPSTTPQMQERLVASPEAIAIAELKKQMAAIKEVVIMQNKLITQLQTDQETLRNELQLLKLNSSSSHAISPQQNTNFSVPHFRKN